MCENVQNCAELMLYSCYAYQSSFCKARYRAVEICLMMMMMRMVMRMRMTTTTKMMKTIR